MGCYTEGIDLVMDDIHSEIISITELDHTVITG